MTALQWKLWENCVILLVGTGEVFVYCTKGNPKMIYKSEPYGVIMYKNPCWIYRDVLFCSTLVSGIEVVLGFNSNWLTDSPSIKIKKD